MTPSQLEPTLPVSQGLTTALRRKCGMMCAHHGTLRETDCGVLGHEAELSMLVSEEEKKGKLGEGPLRGVSSALHCHPKTRWQGVDCCLVNGHGLDIEWMAR